MVSKEKKVNLGNIQKIKREKKGSIVGILSFSKYIIILVVRILSFYWMVWWKHRWPGEHCAWQTILYSDRGNVAQALLLSLYSADKHVTRGAAALF